MQKTKLDGTEDSTINKVYLNFYRCWLDTEAFYIAFLVPVTLVIVFNTVVFVLVSHKLMEHNTNLKKSTRTRTKARLRRVIGVMVALGLTWIFAFLTINDNFGFGLTFQYLFTIANSLQGLFVFIFYVALNVEVRKLWIKIFDQKLAKFWYKHDGRGKIVVFVYTGSIS